MLEYLPSFERDLLARLRLNASDAARVCSITPRQLQYWTRKGFVPTVDDSEHCYDIGSMERAILIRRVMGEGYTLERANKMVNSMLAEEAEEQQKLDLLGEPELRKEISDYLEHLEGRISSLREEIPTYLSLSRLGEAAFPLDGKMLELFFRENPYSFDSAPSIALRLGYAVDDVERLLEDLTHANVLIRGDGDVPIFRLRKGVDVIR